LAGTREEHALGEKEACRKQAHCTVLDGEEYVQQEDEKG